MPSTPQLIRLLPLSSPLRATFGSLSGVFPHPRILHLRYRRDYRQNRRRPKHPILQAIVRLTLLIVALGIVIGVLMRLGFIQEPEREIYVAACICTSPGSKTLDPSSNASRACPIQTLQSGSGRPLPIASIELDSIPSCNFGFTRLRHGYGA